MQTPLLKIQPTMSPHPGPWKIRPAKKLTSLHVRCDHENEVQGDEGPPEEGSGGEDTAGQNLAADPGEQGADVRSLLRL